MLKLEKFGALTGLLIGVSFIIAQNNGNTIDRRCQWPNEEWLFCGPGCGEKHCVGDRMAHMMPSNMTCNEPCQPDCFCKSGYQRWAAGGPCVPSCAEGNPFRPISNDERVDVIDTRCRWPNEVWYRCNRACEEMLCNGQQRGSTMNNCDRSCKSGCFCRPGYVRVAASDACVESCSNINHGGPISRKKRQIHPPLTCAVVLCAPGHFCVETEDGPTCEPSRQCPENQEWSGCHTRCEPSCTDRNPLLCTKECVIGCACKTGFFRNAFGNCVTAYDCDMQAYKNNNGY
ncbi:hypothetical protein WR25_14406 isoform A [Diploscapter pachys]|uniref:TIL domain-containing protein n=1 Tax=Diploscapter pachys TaxID=2018661 RepID=A0A2A2JG82_9BILA|nr:hypothetical protein WR25_14406 isoform A [Diploscapter pachys]